MLVFASLYLKQHWTHSIEDENLLKRDESSLIGLKTQKLEDSLILLPLSPFFFFSFVRTQREDEQVKEFFDNKENEIFQFWKEFRHFLQGSMTAAMLISSKHRYTFKLIDVKEKTREKKREKKSEMISPSV